MKNESNRLKWAKMGGRSGPNLDRRVPLGRPRWFPQSTVEPTTSDCGVYLADIRETLHATDGPLQGLFGEVLWLGSSRNLINSIITFILSWLRFLGVKTHNFSPIKPLTTTIKP